ncbi:MAG: hypothetical protein HLUCCO16_16425 [Phormidium sp. OSCR]|nr:MAG: hypothetical protein HLUCCO16_16425 [Phormidium sp. OSCR]
MIFYLTTRANMNVINWYLEQWGKPLVSNILPVAYHDVFKKRKLPSGTYIFADIERLSPAETEKAAWIWTHLQKSQETRLLNHPLWSMCRYELLKTLYNHGENNFNIYRLTEDISTVQFPVFVRGENDHKGNQTSLLQNQAELDQAIAEIVNQGESRQDKVIIEFCDTRDEQGIFKKYSAFAIGEAIVPVHVRYQKDWVVKANTLKTEQREQENQTYIQTNPHADKIREIFNLARIQYGRIDYSFSGDLMQVWEINTNPTICHFQDSRDSPLNRQVAEQLEQAFTSIDRPSNSKGSISIPPQPSSDTPLEFVSRISEAAPWLPNSYRVTLRKSLRKVIKTLKK